MNGQPRETQSGRFAHQQHSTPEIALFPIVEAKEVDRLAQTLENISVSLAQLESIAERGHEEFFADDFVVRFAALMALVRLGEQAKHLDEAFVVENSAPRYPLMRKQRDFLAHKFRSVDWEMTWRTISRDVPQAAAAHRVVQHRYALKRRRLHDAQQT